MDKLLIINADDFAYDEDATAAILELLETGKITSTTILANFAKPSDLEKLKQIDEVSTGVHVNLISGKALSPKAKVKSLVDDDGEFYPAQKLFQKFLLGQIKATEIKKEISAQINFLKENGVHISHADSHQHLHQFPFLSKIITQTIQENGIQKIRNCLPTSTPSKRAKIIKLFALSTNRNISKFASTQGLIPDFSFSEKYDLPFFEQFISKYFSTNQILEIMTHPGRKDKPGSYLNRKMEFEFWKNTNYADILKKYGVRTISFNQL